MNDQIVGTENELAMRTGCDWGKGLRWSQVEDMTKSEEREMGGTAHQGPGGRLPTTLANCRADAAADTVTGSKGLARSLASHWLVSFSLEFSLVFLLCVLLSYLMSCFAQRQGSAISRHHNFQSKAQHRYSIDITFLPSSSDYPARRTPPCLS